MKTLKQFIDSDNEIISETDILEVSDEPIFEQGLNFTKELPKENHKKEADPPAILVMQRVAIRNYGNQKIALYYIKNLHKYVTIPYDHLKWSLQAEEADKIGDNILPHLQEVVENRISKTVMFENGDTARISVEIADAILKVYGALTEENREKLLEAALKSKEYFKSVANFACKQTNK